MQDLDQSEGEGGAADSLKIAEFGSGSSGILDTLHEYTSNDDMSAFDVVFLDARRFVPRLELLATGDDNLWSGVEKFYARLRDFVDAGGTLIVVPEQWERFSHLNGHLPAAIAGLQELMGCLPVPRAGHDVVALGDARFDRFVKGTEGAIAFSVGLDDVRGTPALASPHNDSCVGAYRLTESDGLVLLLPAFRAEKRDLWLAAATELAASLRKNGVAEMSEPSSLPAWTSRYQFLDETEALERIDERKQQLEDLVRELEQDRDILGQVRARKHLFAGVGDKLRAHVEDALQSLGFELPTLSGGMVEGVASHSVDPNRRVVFVALSSHGPADDAETLKQVFGRLAEYAGQTGEVAKAIAIVNTWRDHDLVERDNNGADFPERLAHVAAQQQWCLMTGLQLLCMSLEAEANPDRRDEIADRILSTNGVLDTYRDWRSYVDVRGL